ncbi:glycosyltransferase family 32 protein [Culicoidibacter larvae]|uniref:Glycosyl transferase n=1 Tax=Culicoidibacter larvae TaxID=2579976 RepID=A0A5R8Q6U5_9FIRM|nr:capsular polysaccharide synthesis protein [Culicoidibacter larvae]TLG71106.1 hypothetical protein FEZ08_11645 [Culicoidibacter larvae]
MAIQNVVYYCWFGSTEKPAEVEQYIAGWKAVLDGFSFVEINETNFDVNINDYVRAAYEAKRFAFVSDYARLYFLNQFGGCYLDTDVEVCRPLDEFLSFDDSIIFSMEQFDHELTGVNTGTIISSAGHPLLQQLLATYDDELFSDLGDATLTINKRITEVLVSDYELKYRDARQHLAGSIEIFPSSVFCVENEEAYTVHRYASSWRTQLSPLRKVRRRIGQFVKRIIGRDRFARWYKK